MSKAQLSIFPVQDILGLDQEARMNTPATTEGNWKWRMDAGALDAALTQRLLELTKKAKR